MRAEAVTSLLLLLAGVSTLAWLAALLHERGVHPLRDLGSLLKGQPMPGRLLLAAFAAATWLFAGAKPSPRPDTSLQTRAGTDGGADAGTEPDSAAPTGSSTNATRTLTAEDFARGFVLTRVGTGEAFDFAAPPGATVCAGWEARGAATDWTYLSFSNRAFRVGADAVSRFRVFSYGKVDLLASHPDTGLQVREGMDGGAAGRWLAPLRATLGVVPRVNWPRIAGNGRAASPDELAPSRFWHFVTPSNTLQITWRNVLLGRRAESPVSFQLELWPNGRLVYRYGLSRLGEGAALSDGSVTNVLVGAALGGLAWTTSALPTNVTSLAFHPLAAEDAHDPDPDGDGLSTVDELFVHGTDPHSPDTDCDGLTDGEELSVFGTDPLDAHSLGGPYSDGLALRLGDADPLSCPEGSTNTVLEHVFYSGTTNGAFALPQPSEGMALLRVSVSGSGTGDLIVGGRVVPLVARRPPATARGGPPRAAPPPPRPLLVQIAKGETLPVYVRGDGLPDVSLNSDDFAFGVLPSPGALGHVNFPNTVATAPCIHDFNARKASVSLPTGRDAELLACTWQGCDGVEVESRPPRAATVTGKFSARETRGLSYTLSHPQYLFGKTTYGQTVRFCPRPPDPDPDDPKPDPPWYSDGEGDDSTSGDDGREERWCCHWGACGEGCACGCDCGSRDGGSDQADDADFNARCPEHGVPCEDCAPRHAEAYADAVRDVPRLGGVLYIRDPPRDEIIRLDVPTEHWNCCPCPSHWTNHVGVAYKSCRLRLLGPNGLPFSRTETSCDVRLAGVRPSASVGDATLAFSRNGEIYRQYGKTVLGVAIKGDGGVDLAVHNTLNHDFGYPMTVCTNAWNAPILRLVTDVRLPGGQMHLELADATGPFAVWYYDRRTGGHRRLLDADAAPVRDFPMDAWKALMRRASDGDSAELPVYVTSSALGALRLVFRYWNVVDGKFVQDEAVQRVTSVLPPLRLDVNRDGAIDGGDSAAWLDGRTFRYWVNEDTARGDHIVPDGNYTTANASDLVVNGTFDLINFFPVALDFGKFRAAWGDRVSYEVKPEWGGTNSFNFCLADVPWNAAGSVQTSNATTLAGQPLSSASLVALPAGGVELPHSDVGRFSEGSGLMVCEAKSSHVSMRVDIKFGGELLYSHSVPMAILPVKQMYSWINGRHLSGDGVVRPTAVHRTWDERNTKSLIFLHGANVSEEQAEQWGDVLFKRLWVSGVHADFYNVDWRGNIGGAANYHENASNAFVVASRLAPILSDIPGEKVIMAHSLGNMVASSMIQDYGLQVSKYIMCNSAVPAEAYDPSVNLRVPQLVHPDWERYPTNSWAANWHTLFKDDENDDRRLMGWSGRFSNVLDKAVNFYSAGDEVLELVADNDVGILTGITSSLAHHAWHKQELFKGRGLGVGMGATDWSGWNVEENWLGVDKIPVAEALRMSDADFRTNTVFYCYPPSMNSTNINLLARGAHLALGIPALTPAAGATDLSDILDQEHNFNLDLTNPGIEHPNGWPSKSSYPNRWLHSDMKDVSYFFNFKFYEKAIEKGGLK